MESLEKASSPPDKAKDDKKKKEKKPGMLSGLFKSKKKDRKSKASDDDSSISDVDRLSGDSTRSSPLRSGGVSPLITSQPNSPLANKGSSSKGKLVKAQPAAVQPIAEPAQEEAPMGFFAELEGSQVAYEAPTGHEDEIQEYQQQKEAEAAAERAATPTSQEPGVSEGMLAPLTSRIRSAASSSQDKPRKAKKTKHRVELDDFDSPRRGAMPDMDDSGDDSITEASPTFMHGTELVHIPTMMTDDFAEEVDDNNDDEHEEEDVSRDGSSTRSSLADAPSDKSTPRQIAESQVDNDDNDDDDATPMPSTAHSPQPLSTTTIPTFPSTHSSTPPPLEASTLLSPQRQTSLSSTASSSSRLHLSPSPTVSTSSSVVWSDASLRAWLEGDNNDVRDMLVVIHDKAGVEPVAQDHPLMAGLFAEEGLRLKGLRDELDGLLGGYMERSRLRSRSVAAV